MKKVFLMIFLCVNLFATNLLTYNVYQREDRLDVVLSFDSPYSGQIIQKPYNIPFYTLVFKDLNYDGVIDKGLNSTLAEVMQISSKGNQTFIVFKSSKILDINAVFLNQDKFSIRIRLTMSNNNILGNESLLKFTVKNEDTKLAGKIGDDIGLKYVAVVGLLFLLILILLFLKKKIANGNKIFKINNKNLNIKYERYLDKNNRFMVLEYEQQSYVVIVGNTNLLLDKKGIKNLNTNESFEAYFEQNKARIQNMISSKSNVANEKDSSLNSYKDRLNAEILNN